MKKLFLSILFSIVITTPIFAAPIIEKKDYTAQVNGTWLQNPIYENKDHAHMYPLREVCQLLGYTVSWEPNTEEITVTGDGITAQLKSGETTILVDGDMIVSLYAQIENKNGNTYVPSLFFTTIFPIKMTNKPNEVVLVEKEIQQITGTIQEATMNTLSIKTQDNTLYTFDTLNADKSKCNGLIIGSEVTVFYTGTLNQNVITAITLEQ